MRLRCCGVHEIYTFILRLDGLLLDKFDVLIAHFSSVSINRTAAVNVPILSNGDMTQQHPSQFSFAHQILQSINRLDHPGGLHLLSR